MSLNDILQKIIDQAEVEVKDLQAQASHQKQEMKKTSQRFCEVKKTELAEKTEEALASVQKKMETMGHQEVARQVLTAKQEVVQAALVGLYNQLVNIDDETYGQIMKKLFVSIENKPMKIITAPNRVEITKQYAPGAAEIEGQKKVTGGFIVESKGMTIDNTFKNMIFSEFKEALTMYFAQKLNLV
jgi:vacuolar-type H+-ATPase subunit E/Vma4